MLEKLKQSLALPVPEGEEEKARIAGLLRVILWTLIVALAALAIAFAFMPSRGLLTYAIIGVLGVVVVGMLFFVRARYVRGVSIALIVLLWAAMCVVMLQSSGIRGSAYTVDALVVLVAGLLLGGWAAVGCAVASALFGLVVFLLESRGVLAISYESSLSSEFVVTTSLIAITAILVYLYQRGLGQALMRAREGEEALSDTNRAYEVRIQHLEHLIEQLKGVAEVSRAAVSVHDLDVLLTEVTQLIDRLFDFYHLGIFLLSDDGQWAVLRASNSEGGQQMLAKGHKLAVGQQGIVGYVTSTGQPRIALDVGDDPVHFRNPMLPDTRSEMALPLKVGDRIIGALDVQSRQEAAYDQDDIMAFHMMADHLAMTIENARLLGATQQAVQALGTQAAEILATTTQQASGATQQSAAISQATTTVDEIKTIAEQLVARSRSVADTAQRSVEVSHAGQEMVRETIAGMSQIKARVDAIEENILALSERTNQIGEIIDTVESIASQSNMLALNAAVEAARAGEQGKGFAVVAEEVRALAERSRQATAQVKAILSDIQRATNTTGMATEEGKKGVDAGVKLVAQMGEAIDQLARAINESAQSAMQMVAGGQQQTSGMDQIAVAMQNINQVTMQGLASTRQAEKSAQELNNVARSLTEIVEQYRV
jgi:methyl-accepting chemotaxis protein